MSKIAPVRLTDVGGTPLGTATNPLITSPAGDVGAGGASTLIGKASGGDFTTAYASATTITLGTLTDATALTADDIVAVEQINSAGAVVATYDRNDATMAISGGVLTITGAAFGATDIFVIYTNLPRSYGGHTGTSSTVGDSASSVTLKAANANRSGLAIRNDSTARLYIEQGATATTSSVDYLDQGDVYELPLLADGGVYRGIVTGIWASDAGGSAYVRENT